MPSYLNQNGNSIGSLLRFIQEQKSQTPIVPPSAQTESPIRGAVQEPLEAPEAVGTSRQVSVRPEALSPTDGKSTPAVSRIGPIQIGGEDVAPPISAVAANEPGSGFTIPSASRTAGDVMNKTAAASGTLKATPIGTMIKPKAAPSVRGQDVTNYNFLRDKANADKTAEDTRLAIAAGERSIPETIAKGEDIYNRFQQGQREFEAQDQAFLNRPMSDRGLAEMRAKRDEIIARQQAEIPTPTPTPTPMQSQGGGGVSQGGTSTGQILGSSTTSRPSSGGLTYSTPPKAPISYGQAKPVNIQQAVQSGGLSQPVKAAAPSIGQRIADTIKKSPWSFLFGR